jgi:tetratricopeptide (TPR) repeat protein
MTILSSILAVVTRGRRRWGAVCGLAFLLAVAGYGWHWWTSIPEPPPIELSGVDPVVAQTIVSAQAAVRHAPRSGAAWGQLGMVLFANRFLYEADVCFARAEQFDPGSPCWPYLHAVHLLVVDREAGLVPLRRAVARAGWSDPSHATMQLVLAEVLIERGDLDEAASLCRNVLDQQPNQARAQFDLGLIALAQDDAQRSIDLLSRAAASPYAARRARLHLATAAHRMGDAATALALLRRAQCLPEDPAWPDPDVDKAKAYQAGIEARMQALKQPDSHAELLPALRELAEESGDGVCQYRLGAALAAGGDYQAAEPVLRVALCRTPGLNRARMALGVVLLRSTEQSADQGQGAAGQARFREAADLFRTELATRPGHGHAHLYLGLCLEHLGQPAQALAALRSAVECHPALAAAQLALGECLAQAGQYDEALHHLHHASDLAPADPRVAAALARWTASLENRVPDRSK